MTQFKIFVLGFLTFSAITSLLGQDLPRDPGGVPVNSPPQWVQRVEDARQRQARQREEMNKAQRPSPVRKTEKDIEKHVEKEEEKKKVIDEINQKLTVSEYRERFAEFLTNKNTGIARMFPEKGCGKGKIVNVQELERCAETPDIPGGGSLYSVRLNELPYYLRLQDILFYVEQSDIHFTDDKFIVGNKTTLDIISNIGDVNLEKIDLKSPALTFLADIKPSKTKSEFDLQKKALEKGINENGYLYSDSAPVRLNDTYILRSIAYHSGYRSFWNTDHLIAFKVVGREKDGSVVILWKKLKEKGAPFLKIE